MRQVLQYNMKTQYWVIVLKIRTLKQFKIYFHGRQGLVSLALWITVYKCLSILSRAN